MWSTVMISFPQQHVATTYHSCTCCMATLHDRCHTLHPNKSPTAQHISLLMPPISSQCIPCLTCLSTAGLGSSPESKKRGTCWAWMATMGMLTCLASTARGLPSIPVMIEPPRSANAISWEGPCKAMGSRGWALSRRGRVLNKSVGWVLNKSGWDAE